uniref:Protein TIC 214 n=1 Tax=Antrophyum semicostatum TaxID=1604141 RepID=A0A3G5CTX0_9MONI|nr:conserved hypothetical chloroplast protein Ycf1 [Antrophyum semicostatum]AYW16305.1 conserved hypothetical chloroplast protein Ycf1 [Antrophyum semicostatum]
MNKSLLILTQLPWPNMVCIYIFLGLYYGLLTTLPVGPPQILFMRSFLLGGNLSGLISLSGLLFAQIITLLSIYWSPIYLLLARPHALTVVSIPYMISFCLLIKDFQNYQIFRPVISLRDSRLARLFLLSFLFQILNPIMLPNPVLTRLIYLNLFRYSTNNTFLIASLMGWLLGQVILNNLSRLLLTRVEKDSPILYLLVKRSIYLTFSIVFIYQSIAYLGRAPVSFLTRKFLNEPDDIELSFWGIAEYSDLLWWFFKPWPTSFFDPTRINRSNRFINNNRFDITSSFYKKRTSTYFFEESLTDGRQRLSFNSLPSLAIFEKWVYRSMTKFRRSKRTRLQLQNWVSRRLIRTNNFQEELTVRLKRLDTRSLFPKTIVKRTRLTSKKKKRIPLPYDPFVNKYRIRISTPQTFLSEPELSMATWEWTEFEQKRKSVSAKVKSSSLKNSLRDWIYAKNNKRRHVNKNPLPWEPLPLRSQRIFQFLFKNRVLYDDEVQNILKDIRSSSETNVTWEEILNLDYEDQILFLTYLQDGSCQHIGWIFPPTRFSLKDLKRLSKLRNKIRRLKKVEDLSMDLARNIALYFENELDLPGIDGDFRHRKLRNVGITFAKGNPQSLKFVKRYAKISDFRRRFLKGSVRFRRRKTVLWKAFQDKIRSPFFLQSLKKPILIKLPSKTRTAERTISRFDNLKKIVDFEIQNIPRITTKTLINELRLVRSAVAARSDIGSIHNGRGYMLLFQSKFRKFIKIPAFIVVKSFGRILFRQRSEWNKDWTDWKKETHINCTFDGEDFSQEELPPRWLREGIQIKIVYPFRFKPWHMDKTSKKRNLRQKGVKYMSKNRNLRDNKRLKQKKTKFTYLTVLGYQTDLPFGTIQKETSFWEPIRKKIIRICKRSVSRQFRHVYAIFRSRFNWKKAVKTNLIPLKEINPTFKFTRSGEMQFDSDSNHKHWTMIPVRNHIDHRNKKKKDTVIESSKSVAIGGEVHSVNAIEKNINLAQESNINDVGIDSVLFSDERLEKAQLDLKKTSQNLVSYNLVSNDINLINLEKLEWKQPIEIEEALLDLYLFCDELFDRSFFILIDLSQIIHRISSHYFKEFIAFYIQLQRLLHDINWKNELLRRSLLSQIQRSSQTNLYAELWDIGMIGDLDIDMLIHYSKSRSYYGKENQLGNSCNWKTSSSNLNQSNIYIKENPVKSGIVSTTFRSSLGKENYEETSKTTNQSISGNITTSVERWGLLNRFKDLSENNWNEWINYLQRYKLSLSMWYRLSPRKWKVNLSKLKTVKIKTRDFQWFQGQSHYYSLYEKKPFLQHRIGNLSKIRKNRNILQALNDFVQDGDIRNFSVQQVITEQEFYRRGRLQKSSKGKGSRIAKSICFRNPHVKKPSKLQFDLISWLYLNGTRTKTFFNFKPGTKSLKAPLLKDNDQYDLVFDISGRFQKVLNELYEIMLDEREDADFIFRWKWKFEIELERINNLIALARTLGDEHDLVTLCVNTEVDSDLLNFYFGPTSRFDLIQTLSVISSYRLPILFDDQDLLFKILQPILTYNSKVKVKIMKHQNKKIYNTKHISNILHILNDWKDKECCIYNIDDLLLPRRRWEFRFLRCFLLSANLDVPIEPPYNMGLKIEQTRTLKKSSLHYISGPIAMHKIKRFLWPSFRLEEVACTSRFCLNITNGNQFTALKIRMYPTSLSQN